MRIPNREINIFNMSMLDVICGALGAFLIVTVVLFPSYQNRATVIVEEVGEAKEANERLHEEIAKARRKAEVPQRLQDRMRENRALEEELRAAEQSRAAKPPAPGSAKEPPLLVWIAWTRPQWTKHFSVSLGLIPSSENTAEAEVRSRYEKDGVGGLFRLYDGRKSRITRYRAPREQPHTVFDRGLEYALVTDPKTKTWYVTYTVSERSDLLQGSNFPGRNFPPPQEVPVYGFAVYGNQEVALPEVSLVSRGDSILIGTLRLDPEKGLRFEKIMERRKA